MYPPTEVATGIHRLGYAPGRLPASRDDYPPSGECMTADSRAANDIHGPKAKGRSPFRDFAPLLCRIFEGLVQHPDQDVCTGIRRQKSASCGTFELGSSFPHFPDIASMMRVSSQPFASFVADSLEGHLFTLSFLGKNCLPLIRLEWRSKTGVVARIHIRRRHNAVGARNVPHCESRLPRSSRCRRCESPRAVRARGFCTEGMRAEFYCAGSSVSLCTRQFSSSAA